jgi:hypothetical protein
MRISTKVTLEICDTLGEYREVSRESYEFDGPIPVACKKGRGQEEANMKFQADQANKNAGRADTSYNLANKFYQDELALNPGQMSNPAAAIYSSDLNNINNTYSGLRQNAFDSAGIRGFAGAPSGFMKSTQNALTVGQNNAQQNAYNNALVQTQAQRENAAAGEAGLLGQANQAELGNTNASSNSAYMRSQMGSTAGDVLGAASSILGGLSGFGALIPHASSSTPSYMPGDNYGQPSGNLPLPGVATFSPILSKNSGVGSY